jgi:hypothetical protein
MTRNVSRRTVLALGTGVVTGVWGAVAAAQTRTPIIVFKDPNCGCCHLWVQHMQASGFVASVTNTDMPPVRKRYKVPEALQSCHTSEVGGYVIEGHVPASDVRALLAKKPKGILGLTIPGMPASAPGMDQLPFRPYTVLTFDAAGKTTVFAKHDKP